MTVRSWALVVVLVALIAGVVVAKRTFLAPVPAASPSLPLAERAQEPPPGVVLAASGIPAKTLTGAQFTAALKNGKPTLADFGAGTCTQCKREAPVLDAAVTKYQGRANIVFVDVNAYVPLARQFGVKFIPTQLFFDAHGREVSRHTGFHPADAVAADLAKAGVK